MTSGTASISSPIAPDRTSSEPRVVASFDWFTLVGSGQVGAVRDIVRRWCGELSPANGAQGYARRMFTDDKAVIFEENLRNAECWQVSLPGAVCAKLDEAIKGPVCELLGLGARVSRIDAAVDLYSVDLVPLIKDRIGKLNEAGWLKRCGNGIRGRGDDPGWTEYLGSTASERFVRVYDKGAKENTHPDYWLRFETVIKRKFARSVGAMLTPEADWPKLAQGLAATGVTELKGIAPDIVEMVYESELQPLTPETKRKTLEGFVTNARRQVFKTLAMLARDADMTIPEVVEALGLDDTQPSEVQSYHSPILSDWRGLLDQC